MFNRIPINITILKHMLADELYTEVQRAVLEKLIVSTEIFLSSSIIDKLRQVYFSFIPSFGCIS